MKAQVLYAVNDIRFMERETPSPKDGEALVHVRAAGICGSDIPRIFVTGAHRMPLIPGHEFAGEIANINGGDNAFSVGDRVGVFPLLPCGTCEACRINRFELCRNYDYIGSRRDGAFAEYVTVPLANLLRLPDTVSYEQAAMLEPLSVSVHAIRRALPDFGNSGADTEKQTEKRIAIFGLGTIGMLHLMVLLDAGYRNLYAIGNKDSQKETAKRLGLSETRFCDSRNENPISFLRDKTDGHCADIVFECVGKNDVLHTALDAAAMAGTIVTVGNPASDMTLSRDIYWKILRNQLTLTGTWNSSYDISRTNEDDDDWHYALNRLKQNALRPEMLITHRFSLETLHTGFRIMKDKSEEYLKIMMQND